MDTLSARQIMVDSQVRVNDVTDPAIHKAMRSVKRERLCAAHQAYLAYGETDVEVAPGRYLMQVRDLAKLLQAAAPKVGETALSICAPYGAAVLAKMGLKVSLLDDDRRALSVVEPYLHDLDVKTEAGDVSEPKGRYDLIVVEGAVASVPEAWLKALTPKGRLVVVVTSGKSGQAFLGQGYIYSQNDGVVSKRSLFDSSAHWLKGFEPKAQFVF